MTGKETTAARGLKHNHYEHVTLKPRTLEIVIAVCGFLIVCLTVWGVATR